MIQATTKELYAMFLESRWWIDLSRTKRRKIGQCERCGNTNRLQSHHRFYRENWFETQLEDLQVLCRRCHENEHGLVKESVPSFVSDVHREIWNQYLRSAPVMKIASDCADPASLTHLRTRKDLMRARSRLEISKKDFRRLLALMPPFKKKRTHPGRGRRRAKQKFIPQRIRKGLNFNQRRNWVNRGSSSN